MSWNGFVSVTSLLTWPVRAVKYVLWTVLSLAWVALLFLVGLALTLRREVGFQRARRNPSPNMLPIGSFEMILSDGVGAAPGRMVRWGRLWLAHKADETALALGYYGCDRCDMFNEWLAPFFGEDEADMQACSCAVEAPGAA